jgi:energy-converting hydrogenase Eha subunit A
MQEHELLVGPVIVDVSRQNENYRVRYVELARAIGGVFLGFIYFILTRSTTLTGSTLMLVGNTIANFMGWLIGEQIIHRLCVYLNLYTPTTSKNPLYRNFKTLASLGFSLGIIFALWFSSLKDLKFGVSIYSASLGFILGLSAFAIRAYRRSLPPLPESEKNIDAQVGTEGWSKYTKLALIFGTSIGQSIGGYISYVGGYDALASWSTITLYGAIAGVVSFFSVIALVPMVNYLTRDAHTHARGVFVSEDKDEFNSNYIRSGMTLGVALGTIVGGLLGPVLMGGLTMAVGITIGAGIFSIVCGITLGVYGHRVTVYLQTHWNVPVDTDNSWSYAARNTSYVFGFIGTVFACVFCPGAALLQSAAIGSAISGLIGWFAGLGILWKARQLEPGEEKSTLPWTQRISTGANRGSNLGAFTGLILALGFCSGGVLGLVGWITLASALGGLVGAVKDGMDDSVTQRIISKSVFGDTDALIPPISGSFQLLISPSSYIEPPTEIEPRNSPSVSPSALLKQYTSNSNLLFSPSHSGNEEDEQKSKFTLQY